MLQRLVALIWRKRAIKRLNGSIAALRNQVEGLELVAGVHGEVQTITEHRVTLKGSFGGRTILVQYHAGDCIWDGQRVVGIRPGADPAHVSRAPDSAARDLVEITPEQESAILRHLKLR